MEGLTLGEKDLQSAFFLKNFKQWRRAPLLTWDSFLNAVVNVKAVLKHFMHHFIMIHGKEEGSFLYPLNNYTA